MDEWKIQFEDSRFDEKIILIKRIMKQNNVKVEAELELKISTALELRDQLNKFFNENIIEVDY